jgi:hypothetical protein
MIDLNANCVSSDQFSDEVGALSAVLNLPMARRNHDVSLVANFINRIHLKHDDANPRA